MIYFIRSADGSRIKIGTTIRLSQRLKQLAAEYGEGLEVLAVTDGSFEVERELHGRFAHLRIVNEWFEPGEDLTGFIVADGKVWDGTDEVEDTRKPVRLTLPVAYHRLLRRIAADAETSMSNFAETAMMEILDQEAANRGIKF